MAATPLKAVRTLDGEPVVSAPEFSIIAPPPTEPSDGRGAARPGQECAAAAAGPLLWRERGLRA